MAKRTALTALPDGEDRAALETLYRATEGPNWLESRNWLTDAPLGEWYGVSTNETGRVRSLGLADKDLTGPIPPEVGNLAVLEVLDLNGNNLTGPIPPGDRQPHGAAKTPSRRQPAHWPDSP